MVSNSKLINPQKPLDGKLTFSEIIVCSLATTIVSGVFMFSFGVYSFIMLFKGNPFPFIITIFGSCVFIGCVGNL
jgi:hypothetical protein